MRLRIAIVAMLFHIAANAAALPTSGVVNTVCGTAKGTRFNLEPRANAVAQDNPSIAVLPGAGLGAEDLIVGTANDYRHFDPIPGPGDYYGSNGLLMESGYYVHLSGSDANPCEPDFEGGLPLLVNGAYSAGGEPIVAADPAHSAFVVVDLHSSINGSDQSGIGLFRNTAANLTDSSQCPAGTHNQVQAAACWSNGLWINTGFLVTTVKPQVIVDQRASGTGAGDVYVSVTGSNAISLFACKNDLSACSPGSLVSGAVPADLSNLALRSDGTLTMTYASFSDPVTTIYFLSCAPAGAPQRPVCSTPAAIVTENQSIPYNPFDPHSGLEAVEFTMHTWPKHVHRTGVNGTDEVYVIWDRCKVSPTIVYPTETFFDICPDADVVGAVSTDGGSTWNSFNVDVSPQDQFEPALAVDPVSNAIDVFYYSSAADRYQHRSQVMLAQIPAGTTEATAPLTITSEAMDPNTDPTLGGSFIGYYMGAAVVPASGASRAYVHYTHTGVDGTYNGAPEPEQNNHISRVDF